jgi:hypothetical protein
MALRLRGAKQLFWQKLKVSSSMTGSDALDPTPNPGFRAIVTP